MTVRPRYNAHCRSFAALIGIFALVASQCLMAAGLMPAPGYGAKAASADILMSEAYLAEAHHLCGEMSAGFADHLDKIVATMQGHAHGDHGGGGGEGGGGDHAGHDSHCPLCVSAADAPFVWPLLAGMRLPERRLRVALAKSAALKLLFAPQDPRAPPFAA